MERRQHPITEDNFLGNQSVPEETQNASLYQETEGVYSGRTIAILTLLAKGQRMEEVAQGVSLGVSTVKNHLSKNVYKPLGVISQAGAVFYAVHDGILDPLEIVERDTLQYVERLTPKERIVLKTITTKGNDATNNGIITTLNIGITTSKQYINSILDKLETPNRISAGMIFLAYEKAKTLEAPIFSSEQIKILLLMMMGQGSDTVRKDLGKTRGDFKKLLHGELGLFTQLHATSHRELFTNAIDKGVVVFSESESLN